MCVRTCLRLTLAAIVGGALLARGTEQGAAPSPTMPRLRVSHIALLTGLDSPNRTHGVGVAGTDLGSMFELDGRVCFLFGDTFAPKLGAMSRAGWRSNTMAYSTDFDARDGIRFDGWITDPVTHWAAEILPSRKDPDGLGERTVIPTAGIALDGTIYVFYQSVRRWGPPGYWDVNHSGIGVSHDSGQTFVKHEPMWGSGSNFAQVAVSRDVNGDGPEPSGVFVCGIGGGRQGPVKLAWVPTDGLLDPAAYRYFAGVDERGTPLWDDEEVAAQVIPGPCGEPSVLWNPYLDRWMLVHLVPGPGQIRLVMRLAAHPWGPWGEPLTVLTARECPQLYGGFMHPRYTESDGRVVYLLVSRFDIYNVSVFRVEFE